MTTELNGLNQSRNTQLLAEITHADFTPTTLIDFFHKIDPQKQNELTAAMISRTANTVDSDMLKQAYTLAQRQYPGIPPYQEDEPIIILWNHIHTYQKAQHIFPDVKPATLFAMPRWDLENLLNIHVTAEQNDKRKANFTLIPNPDADPRTGLFLGIPKEAQPFREAAHALESDPQFAASLYKHLQTNKIALELTDLSEFKTAGGANSVAAKAVLHHDGVSVPLFIKTPNIRAEAESHLQTELDFMKRWQQNDGMEEFLTHSSLQTPIYLKDKLSLAMLDLKRLGYRSPDHVFSSVNGFTHKGRAFLLDYLSSITAWLSKIEHHTSAADTFPSPTAWVSPRDTKAFRTFDYGYFRPLSTTTKHDIRNLWFDPDRGSAGIKIIPILTPLWKRNSDHVIPKDSVLDELKFYDHLRELQTQQTPVTWNNMHTIFSDTKHAYDTHPAIHVTDRHFNHFPISPSFAAREMISILTPIQKMSLISNADTQSSSPFNRKYKRARSIQNDVEDPNWYTYQLLGARLRISQNEAKRLIDHTTMQTMNNMYENMKEES